MKLSRRSLFRLLGVGAAGTALTRFMPTAEAKPVAEVVAAKVPVLGPPWPAPVIVDVGGSALAPEHFRTLLNCIQSQFGEGVYPDEWLIHPATLRDLTVSFDGMVIGLRWDGKDAVFTHMNGIPFTPSGTDGRREILAPRKMGNGGLPLLLGKIRNIGRPGGMFRS